MCLKGTVSSALIQASWSPDVENILECTHSKLKSASSQTLFRTWALLRGPKAGLPRLPMIKTGGVPVSCRPVHLHRWVKGDYTAQESAQLCGGPQQISPLSGWSRHLWCAGLLEIRIGEIYKTRDSRFIPGIFLKGK